jgi:hypothetical protein
MAVGTAGTTAATTLSAITWSGDQAVLLPADLATANYAILDDQNVAHGHAAVLGLGGVVREGKLIIPNRYGSLVMLPGDVVAWDVTGWPVLISARAIAGGGWHFAP